ncbi:MAG TPA: hypothetical protein VGG11_13825 [Xanthobacteraceae bacterium]|jgi:hypothetical protein
MNLFEKLAKLKELYPEDIERIAADEHRVSELLKKQDYAGLEITRELLALCRKDILAMRVKLATERTLSDDARAECWFVIEARLWVIRTVAKDYESELSQLDRELAAELAA